MATGESDKPSAHSSHAVRPVERRSIAALRLGVEGGSVSRLLANITLPRGPGKDGRGLGGHLQSFPLCVDDETGEEHYLDFRLACTRATGHSYTARMHWRNRRVVFAFVCQMGPRISSTSALVTSDTGVFALCGMA